MDPVTTQNAEPLPGSSTAALPALNACPHCGGQDSVKFSNTAQSGEIAPSMGIFVFVQCEAGHAQGCGARGGWADTEQEATNLWNRRPGKA